MNRFFIIIAILLFCLPQLLSAYILRSGDEIYLTGNYKEDILMGGGIIKIDAVNEGDIIVAGNVITMDGELDGNFNAVAKRITVNGLIKRSVRCGAQYITINSQIEGDLVAFAQDIVISSDAEIKRDCAVFASEVMIDGKIDGKLQAYGAFVTISGTFKGDVEITGEKITISPSTVIDGDLIYKSNKKAQISPEATIMGETKFKRQRKESSPTEFSPDFGLGPLMSALFFVGSLIIGAIIVIFNRQMVLKISDDMKSNFILHGLLGLAIIVLVPFLLFIAGITLIGLPVMLVGSLLYFVLFFVAKIFVGITIGIVLIQMVKNGGKVSLAWSLLIGMVLLALTFKIPYLGWFVYIGAWSVGTGALTFCFFRRAKMRSEKPNGEVSPSAPEPPPLSV